MQPLVSVQVPNNLSQDRSVNIALTTPNLIRISVNELPKLEAAISILNQSTNRTPSLLAGIKESILPSVQYIDDAFNSAVEAYREKLRTASTRDIAQNITVIRGPYAGIMGVAKFTSEHLPANTFIREVSYPFFDSCRSFLGIL